MSQLESSADPNLQYHYDTYRGFLRYGLWFVAHVVTVLALLAYFTTGSP